MSASNNEDRLMIDPASITSVLDKGVKFVGSLESETGKSIMINGEFHGDLKTNGAVIISRGAVFNGNLQAQRIRLVGKIGKGADGEPSRVVALDSLAIERSGVLETDELSYGGLDLQFGGELRANVVPLAPRSEADVQDVEPAPHVVPSVKPPTEQGEQSAVATPGAPAFTFPMSSVSTLASQVSQASAARHEVAEHDEGNVRPFMPQRAAVGG